MSGKSLHIIDPPGSGNSQVVHGFEPTSNATLEFYMIHHSSEFGPGIQLRGGDYRDWAINFWRGGNSILLSDTRSASNNKSLLSPYKMDTWYYMRRDLDFETNSGSFYAEEVGNPSVNAFMELGPVPFYNDRFLDRLNIDTGSPTADGHIDEIRITRDNGDNGDDGDIPEPATLMLVGSALLGLGAYSKSRTSKKKNKTLSR